MVINFFPFPLCVVSFTANRYGKHFTDNSTKKLCKDNIFNITHNINAYCKDVDVLTLKFSRNEVFKVTHDKNGTNIEGENIEYDWQTCVFNGGKVKGSFYSMGCFTNDIEKSLYFCIEITKDLGKTHTLSGRQIRNYLQVRKSVNFPTMIECKTKNKAKTMLTDGNFIAKVLKNQLSKNDRIIEKTIKLTAEISNVKKEHLIIMKNESTTFQEKLDICKENMEFNNLHDQHNIEWHLDNVEYLDGSLKNASIQCKTKLHTSAVVNESQYDELLKESSIYDFNENITIVKFEQTTVKEISNVEKKKAQKYFYIKIGIIIGILLLFITLFCWAYRFATLRTRKKKKRFSSSLRVNSRKLQTPNSTRLDIIPGSPTKLNTPYIYTYGSYVYLDKPDSIHKSPIKSINPINSEVPVKSMELIF
ncbi:hypothetical protein SNEBB_002719 [Seison nebaliae]|nr:hypothetical protein SNEBB_002719 [Seison nebaliae]